MASISIAIPARYESSRFPGKVLYPINNKAMVEWTYEQCVKTGVQEVVVLTDHIKVIEYLQKKKIPTLLTSTKCESGTERIASVIDQINGDFIINVQADEPLITPEMIQDVIHLLENNSEIDIATLAKKEENIVVAQNPNRVKVVLDSNFKALYFSRALIPFPREEGDYWLIHLGIYGYKRHFLENFHTLKASRLERIEKLEQLQFLYNGYRIGVQTGEYQLYGVDVPEDIKYVEQKLKERK